MLLSLVSTSLPVFCSSGDSVIFQKVCNSVIPYNSENMYCWKIPSLAGKELTEKCTVCKHDYNLRNVHILHRKVCDRTMKLWQGDPFADLWAVVAKPPQEEICHQCPTSVGLPASSHLALLFGHRWHNNTDYKLGASIF